MGFAKSGALGGSEGQVEAERHQLSGGQQQRLCIARGIAVKPEVLLLDEPASALDPISTGRIEELVHELKNDYTIVIVTHNMQQAARVSDYTAYMYLGEMVEFGVTDEVFIKREERDGGLHHRPVRLNRSSAMAANTFPSNTTTISRPCARGFCRWAGLVESPDTRGHRCVRARQSDLSIK